jgi:hypothetical protein
MTELIFLKYKLELESLLVSLIETNSTNKEDVLTLMNMLNEYNFYNRLL